MNIDTTFFQRCIQTLEVAYLRLLETNNENIEYDLFRSACIKEYEIILEQSGKLLRKALAPFFHSSKAVDKLTFKDVFRNGVLRQIISTEECERWLSYRDNRNSTAHDYGVLFAEETLLLLPNFIADAKKLNDTIKSMNNN